MSLNSVLDRLEVLPLSQTLHDVLNDDCMRVHVEEDLSPILLVSWTEAMIKRDGVNMHTGYKSFSLHLPVAQYCWNESACKMQPFVYS